MKKGIVVLAVTAVFLCGTLSLNAQQSNTRMGVGLILLDRSLFNIVGMLSNVSSDNLFGSADMSMLMPPSRIHFPIKMGNMMIEPEFGFYRTSASESDDLGESTESSTSLRIGGGLFMVSPLQKVDFYYGGRVGIVRYSEKQEYDPKTGKSVSSSGSQTNLYLGPCMGAEYYINEHFSFGGEAQFLYTKFGNFKMEDEDADGTETSRSLMDTRYLFIFRWYMN
ncbi:MAG TPA: outer membrane beta-barrel protein [bacterium]